MEKKYTVLVAEDEEYNFTLLKYILNREGINILWARNGKEAIDIFTANNDISLIMMDIKMPVMNGLEATKAIKLLNPDIPIIAVTAYALAEDREICFKSGCDEFITKPINRQHLMSLTYKLLEE